MQNNLIIVFLFVFATDWGKVDWNATRIWSERRVQMRENVYDFFGCENPVASPLLFCNRIKPLPYVWRLIEANCML